MTSSSKPPAAPGPERCLVVYDGDVLVAALAAPGGPVRSARTDASVLLEHAALHGRFAGSTRVDAVVGALRSSPDVDTVVRALTAAGLEVVTTPSSVVRHLLEP